MGTLLKMAIFSLKNFIIPIIIALFIFKLILRQKSSGSGSPQTTKIAFFHPYCNAAGGGEKVLWRFIHSLLAHLQYADKISIAIYTGDSETASQILSKASARFNIDLSSYESRIEFVRVSGRKMLEPLNFATMVFQMLGTAVYTVKCIWNYQPDIFIDSTGFAFSYAVVKTLLPTTKVISYTHYPFISSDMISKVQSNQTSFNNRGFIASSKVFSALKYFYYLGLTQAYKAMGKYIDLVFTNSTWTNDHIRKLWLNALRRNPINEPVILYPPCNVNSLLKMKKNHEESNVQIMSFAQFRPEKDHLMQIRIFERVLARLQDQERASLTFRIVGSVRNEEDEILLEQLKAEVEKRSLTSKIIFVKNPPFSDLLHEFETSSIGLHTMRDEHFGIAVVEMMAGGLITIAHSSAGPLKDIIQSNEFGFLCATEDEYVDALLSAIRMKSNEKARLVSAAREKVKKFSDEEFTVLIAAHVEHFMESFKFVNLPQTNPK